MIAYLVKSGLCLAILLAFYHLVLEREKMHQFNRFYLLGSVLFSFLVPFVIIYVEADPVLAEEITKANANIISITENSVDANTWGFTEYAIITYLSITFLMLLRFIKSLIDILLKIRQNQIISYKKAKLVLVNDDILPHTFWNFIFISKEEYLSKKVEKELFTHELTHVTQRHTLDVLIIEALQIVLWFNPFFYPLKKAIQLNHEFLADDKVIASHQDIPKYQYLLLDKAAWKNTYYLASNLNYSLTKKRLLMMKTQNSKSTILWKKLAIIPLVGGLIFLFADRVEAQSTKKKPVVKEIKKQGASDAQMAKYQKMFKEAEKSKQFKLDDIEEMKSIYNVMTDQQKRSVKNIDDHLPPPPPRPVRIEVVDKDKIPPPPPPRKKKVKKVKKVKTEKSPKVAKKLKEAKRKKELKELKKQKKLKELEKKKKIKEEKVEEFIEEKEVPVVIEIKEVPEGDEEEEVEVIEVIKETPEMEEVEEVEEVYQEKKHEKHYREHEHEKVREHKGHHDAQSMKEEYEKMVKVGAKFYLNGKKISAKKVKKYFFEKGDEVQTLDIVVNKKGKYTVKLRTK